MKEKGFILVTSILIVFMMLAVLGYVQLKTISHIKTSQFSGIQMESMKLAEMGANKASRMLSTQDINSLLISAKDESLQAGDDYSLNPLDPSEARSNKISELESKFGNRCCFSKPDPGKAVVFKISNNPEEPPSLDSDGKVIVRSFGIVENGLLESEIGITKNQITILESIFRKDKPFMIPAPVILRDPDSRWFFNGLDFRVSGGDQAAILLLGTPSPVPANEIALLNQSLDEKCIDYQGNAVAAAGPLNGYANLTMLSSQDFWDHFKSNIDEFAIALNKDLPCPDPGLYKFSNGSLVKDNYSGVLVTSGDIELGGIFSLNGLLIHLGGGELVLSEECSINGGVIYTASLEDDSSSIVIQDQARIVYSPESIDKAHNCFPVTHLGTRIISE